jgi:hypothetical protein
MKALESQTGKRIAQSDVSALSTVVKRLILLACQLGGLLLLMTALLPLPARAQPLGAGVRQESVASPAAPEWIEPRGLSIVDLVGAVPEEHLQGSIVRYWPGAGLALYEWGRRDGDTVTIRVKIIMQYRNMTMCLGKPGDRDEWPVTVPESAMRLFDNGVEVTRQLASDFEYFPAGFILPNANSEGQRYPEYGGQVRYNAAGEVIVPANSGCWFWLQNPASNLTAEFRFQSPPVVSMHTLGSQTFTFNSYVGPGYAGLLGSLQDQMSDRFGARHQYFDFTPPAGTNYILVRYPLTPVDPYGYDPYYPGAGTYRVRSAAARLSVDHINTMGIPFYGQWRDADLSGGSDYLRFFNDPVGVSAPEYFVPTGIAYDPCMSNGGCPSSLLDAIYAVAMPLTVYFYRLTTAGTGLTAIPLRQVGPGWNPSDAAGASASEVGQEASPPASAAPANAPAASPELRFHTYIPSVSYQIYVPLIDPSRCPCGIFTGDGRMVGYIPASAQ